MKCSRNRRHCTHCFSLEWLIVSFVDGSVSSYPVLHGIGDISLGEPCVLWKGDRITCTNMVYNNQVLLTPHAKNMNINCRPLNKLL